VERRWNFARVVVLVLGCLGVLFATGLLTAGGFGLWADQTRRDSEDYLSTRHEPFSSSAYAILSKSVDVGTEGPDWVLSEDVLGKVRLGGGTTNGKDVFLGIGPADDVDAYLGGVERDVVRDLEVDPFRVEYRHEAGGAPEGPPGDETFWAATASGAGEQTLLWEVEGGDWSVVVMNADASQDVDVSLSVGAEATFLLWLSIALLILGTLVLLGSVLLVFLALRGGAVVGEAPAGAPRVAHDYPVGVRGELDTNLSRWLWLVKWILAIPHYIVLALLWLAFFVLSVVAFFAILFTGRYPRGIFDFNTGVIRWTWRVMFYSYWALGTDRYPPFTLGHAPDYPASVDIAYPEQGLSRGLVLVKWWLLAIPHYILVGIFVGGWWWGFGHLLGTSGLIGLLAFFAGVALLFRARYPRGIFDLILGLDRWVLRVVAYAGLMTDRYPPFRLDQGPDEPPAPPES
jgi:hypothetical protein